MDGDIESALSAKRLASRYARKRLRERGELGFRGCAEDLTPTGLSRG